VAIRRKTLEEILKIAGQLPQSQQLELIARLSSRLTIGKKRTQTATKTWMDVAGLGAELWRNTDAQEYVRQERASWDD